MASITLLISCTSILLLQFAAANTHDLEPRALIITSTIYSNSGTGATSVGNPQPSATTYSNNDPNNCGFGEVNADNWRKNNIDTWLKQFGESRSGGQNLTVALGQEYAPNVAKSISDCNVYSACSVRWISMVYTRRSANLP